MITTETQKGHNYLRCTKRKNPCEQKYVREELITSQIKKEIKKVSLPLDWVNWMIEENRKDQSSEIQSSEIFSQKTKDEISLLDSKIEKLMNAYLENALSLDEYRESKNKLMCQKQLLKEKLSAFEKKSHNRFVSCLWMRLKKKDTIIPESQRNRFWSHAFLHDVHRSSIWFSPVL